MPRSTAELPGLPLICGGSSLLVGSDLALAFEFALHGHVVEALLLDLGELDDFGLGVRLQTLELFAGTHRRFLLAFEVGALFVDLLHRSVEVVEFDGGCAACDGCLSVGGDAGVGLVEVDQEGDRTARVGEAALGVGLQTRSHRCRLCFDGGELLLGLDHLEVERVELRFGVEHGLSGRVGAIAGSLDLVGCSHGRRVLRGGPAGDDDGADQ